MPVSLGVVCLSLACVNQSFAFVFLVFYWTRTLLDESETEVISLACLVSQHAIRHHVKDRKDPHCADTIRPVVCRLSRKPDGMDENIPPPKNFRYFLFLAKEDPDMNASSGCMTQPMKSGLVLLKRPPMHYSQIQLCQPCCDESQLLLGIPRFLNGVHQPGNTHGRTFSLCLRI